MKAVVRFISIQEQVRHIVRYKHSHDVKYALRPQGIKVIESPEFRFILKILRPEIVEHDVLSRENIVREILAQFHDAVHYIVQDLKVCLTCM